MVLRMPARTFRPENEPPFTGNYFVAVYPPVSFWRRADVPRLSEVLGQPGRSRDLTLYVHIPFCERKCDFCFYRSYTGRPLSDMAAYVDSLLAEVRHYARTPFLRGRRLSCVYFGGGTPSLLPPLLFRRLAEGIKLLLPWEGMREATFECAPRTGTASSTTRRRWAGEPCRSRGPTA